MYVVFQANHVDLLALEDVFAFMWIFVDVYEVFSCLLCARFGNITKYVRSCPLPSLLFNHEKAKCVSYHIFPAGYKS